MRRRPADVPLARDTSERFLPWLVAFMVYFAALAAVSATMTHRMVQRWDKGLTGQLTVEVPPPGPEATEGERQERLDRVVELLGRTGGVREVVLYGADDIADLLEPWLGSGARELDLPLPGMIAVTFDTSAPPDLAELAERLEQVVPGTLLDDHRRWLGSLVDLARSVQAFAGVIVLLVGLVAVLAIIFVTRTGLSIHRNVIEILHLIGAQDSYIASQFQRHALALGLRGGLIGSAFAVATALAMGYMLGRVESALLPDVLLSVPEWVLLALLPLATAGVAMITARMTVLGTLARMP
jgi:cell division transport system permease protein